MDDKYLSYYIAPDGTYLPVVDPVARQAVEGISRNLKDGSTAGSLRTVESAEEAENYTIGTGAMSQGYGTYAPGPSSHSEGLHSVSLGEGAHAEGDESMASGRLSHAEGYRTVASAPGAHSAGYQTEASGFYSHTEGSYTVAAGESSHAEGYYTNAAFRSQHVFGEFNELDTASVSPGSRGTYIEIVGNGGGSQARSNARTLDWQGNEKLSGKLTLGAVGTESMDAVTVSQLSDVVSTGASPYTSNPLMDGVASSGTVTSYAKGDHVHPSDTSKANAVVDRAYINPQGDRVVYTASSVNNEREHLELSVEYLNPDYQPTGDEEAPKVGSYVDIETPFNTSELTSTSSYLTLKSQDDNGGLSLIESSVADNEAKLRIFVSDSGFEPTDSNSAIVITDEETIIHNVPDPDDDLDAVNKQYVDSIISLIPESLDYVRDGQNGAILGDTENNVASGTYSVAEGSYTTSSGAYSHAEGFYNTASGITAHVEGGGAGGSGSPNTASGIASHAEGRGTRATNHDTHAEGTSTEASGFSAHAEGRGTIASADYSHSEGYQSTASGSYSHSEGCSSIASGIASHAEGGAVDERYISGTTASGNSAHAEGLLTTASGLASHAEGRTTKATKSYQHVFGTNNKTDIYSGEFEGNKGRYVEIVGNGLVELTAITLGNVDYAIRALPTTSSSLVGTLDSSTFGGRTIVYERSATDSDGYKWYFIEVTISGSIKQGYISGYPDERTLLESIVSGTPSNARTLDWNGNEILSGKLTVGVKGSAPMDVATVEQLGVLVVEQEIVTDSSLIPSGWMFTTKLTMTAQALLDAMDANKIVKVDSGGIIIGTTYDAETNTYGFYTFNGYFLNTRKSYYKAVGSSSYPIDSPLT